MGKTLVLLDRHVAGHHADFLVLFAKAFSEHAKNVILCGPGASRACSRIGDGFAVKEVVPGRWFALLGSVLRVLGMNPGQAYYLSASMSIRHQLRSIPAKNLLLFLPYIYEGELGRWNAVYFRSVRMKWGTLSSEGRWVRHPERFKSEDPERYSLAKVIHDSFVSNLFSSGVRVLGVLDERIELEALKPEGHYFHEKVAVIRIPEIVEGNSQHNGATFAKIKNWSDGRIVVLIAGGLKAGKGLVDFCRSALDANDRFCFVIAGRIFWNSYTPEEVGIIRHAIATAPSLMAILDERLEDQYFNGALKAADLLYLKYENWTNSSNMLSQAVRFETPVLVLDQFLMGERVSRFKLGIRVQSDCSDPLEMRTPEEILALAEEADWQGYRDRHNWNAFKVAVGEVFRYLAGEPSQGSD